jgi:tetratricopeptide (TPR) repeat protein/predicted Ser/Thr protein kinase
MSKSDQPVKPDTAPDGAGETPALDRPIDPTFVAPGGAGTWRFGSHASPLPFEVPAPGHVLLERYTVLGQLGEGGMGVVLSVYDARLDRRVALKLLRPGEESGNSQGEQGRFLREAQAMARLNHPHVVAVYDAGALETGSLFIAMEHVEGQTLRRWQQQRSWRDVLDKYLDAGRGLAAAHAAGLIHRDFKPDNVLVGQDGRVRVTDFGLARADSLPATERGPTPSSSALPPQALMASLTLPGTWMGTPRYMAPEVLKGQRADARSDLYSFCASLYEALYGQLPFTGDSVSELLKAQQAGKSAPPARSNVPEWVGRTVLQGLRADPALRLTSMGVLLEALQDDPEVKRRLRLRQGAGALVTVALAGLAVWGWWSQHDQGCGRMGLRLAGVWDTAVKAKVEQALLGTGLSYAPGTAERVAAALDAYAGAWLKQRTEVCEGAEQAGGAQARGLVLLRESCLEQRRSQLQALTELLSQAPDAQLVGKAVQVVLALPPLEYCADARALTASVPPPEDPAIRAKVESLQAQVDRLEVLVEAGRYPEGLLLAETLLPQAKAIGYAPLHARTLLLSARLHKETGAYAEAEEWARQTITVASQGRDIPALSRAWSLLVRLVGQQGRNQEALLMQPASEALAELADDDLVRATAISSLGSVLSDLGRYEEAQKAHERVLALRQKALGSEHPDTTNSLNNLGGVLYYLGKYEEAREIHARALALREKILGPEHPHVAVSLNNLGLALWKQGHLEEARAAHERALALREKAMRPDAPDVAASLNNLGLVLIELQRYEEAVKLYQRVLAMWEKVLGPDHPDVALALNNLGTCFEGLGNADESLRMYERALALRRKALGPAHPEVANSLASTGNALRRLGRYAEARERLKSALALQEKVLGPDHPDVSAVLLGQGRIALDQHRPTEAISPLERALKLAPELGRAAVQLALAQALWDSNRDRARARELATEAQEYWRQHSQQMSLHEADQWLEAHTTP